MLDLSSLIAALQSAAQEASATVATEQVKLLQRFFHGLDLERGLDDPAPEPLRPVMVRMGYPRETEDGPEEHIVYVPLVTLAAGEGAPLHDWIGDKPLVIVFGSFT
jgi:hypothetical protein